MFQAYLDAHKIAYDAPSGDIGFHVLEDLNLSEADITELPAGLVVYGSLVLHGADIPRLPDRLIVTGHLHLSHTSIQALPPDLSVGGDILMAHSQIRSLPPGLNVPGILDLRHTPIDALPEGLVVENSLDLRDTGVVRLPPDLQVGGLILPPSRLLDLQAFMRGRPHLVQLSLEGTHHQRLALLAELQRYPDLYRVMQSLGPFYALSIWRNLGDDYAINAKRVHR